MITIYKRETMKSQKILFTFATRFSLNKDYFMTSDQNKIKRFIRLDQLLRDSGGHTLHEILVSDDVFDISDRQLRQNLKEFETVFGAEFDREACRGRETLWKYKDPNFSIFQQLNRDVEIIHATVERLKMFKGDPRYDWLRLFLMSVEAGIQDESPIMTFDSNSDLRGLEKIEDLGLSIMHKYPIKLGYKPYGKELTIQNVHPYHLRQYNNRWFLLGWSEEYSAINVYAIDRIESIEHLSKTYIAADIDLEEYFKDIVGVSKHIKARPFKVVLRVAKRSIEYLRTKPLHRTQMELTDQETEDSVFLQLQVRVNTELEMLLMSYGDELEVIHPRFLRDKIAEKIRNMARFYQV